jgi:deoxyribonuclease-4
VPRPSGPAHPERRRLGAHLPISAGILRAVERAAAIGAEAIQIFSGNPAAWQRRAELPVDLPAFRGRAAELGIGPIAIHASYLINLAGPDGEVRERSIRLLAHELAVAPAYGARFVNVHLGSHKGAGPEAGIEQAADGIARALAEAPEPPGGPLLVLENSAGGGGGLGTAVEEIARILDAVAARGGPAERVGLCLDTAHLWGAGYDVATAGGADAVLAALDAQVGLDRLVMVHLNDSKAGRGSRLDRHQHLGAGELGPGEGLARFLTHPKLAHVAYYLETPGMDAGYDEVNLARARRLAAGEPLAALPLEAFELQKRRPRARTPAPQYAGVRCPRCPGEEGAPEVGLLSSTVGCSG